VTPRTLHLLRHGAPDVPGRLLGRTDAASTPEGIRACLAQAAALDVTHVVSSDLQRARRAAAAIAASRSLPLVIDPRWRELDFGAWDGHASDTLDAQALAAFYDDPDANPPPNGERWSALVARVSAALDAFPPGPVLVVTHGGAIRAALHVLCGFDQRMLWAFALPYAARLSLQVWPSKRPNAQITALVP
jgi:alpha-ribazole phosphatase